MCGYASVVSAFSIALASICLGNGILPGVLRKFFGRYLFPRVDRSCERGGLLKYVLCAALSLNYMCVTGIEIPWRERALPLLRGFPVAGCVLARIMVGRVLHVLAETMVVHVWREIPHVVHDLGVYWPSLGLCSFGINWSNLRSMLGVYVPCATAMLLCARACRAMSGRP